MRRFWRTFRDAERARWPFLVVILSPLITVPLTASVLARANVEPASIGLPPNAGYVESWFPCDHRACEYYYARPERVVLAFLLPGAANLLPFLWLAARAGRVKAAGAAAGVCGLVRSAIPLVLVLSIVIHGDYADPTTGPAAEQDQSPLKLVKGGDGEAYLWHQEDGFFQTDSIVFLWFLGAPAWLGTLATWGVFTLIRRRWDRRGSGSMIGKASGSDGI